MRKIKFRAWDIPNNCFIPNDCYVICNDSKSLGMMIKNWNNYLIDEYMYSPNQTLNQFTGLQDKNGVDIYESDIIQYTQHLFCTKEEDFPTKTKVVKWLGDRWNVYETNAGESDIEIIGNIYENPELL